MPLQMYNSGGARHPHSRRPTCWGFGHRSSAAGFGVPAAPVKVRTLRGPREEKRSRGHHHCSDGPAGGVRRSDRRCRGSARAGLLPPTWIVIDRVPVNLDFPRGRDKHRAMLPCIAAGFVYACEFANVFGEVLEEPSFAGGTHKDIPRIFCIFFSKKSALLVAIFAHLAE